MPRSKAAVHQQEEIHGLRKNKHRGPARQEGQPALEVPINMLPGEHFSLFMSNHSGAGQLKNSGH